MEFYIRRAREGDQAAIKRLIHEAGINPFHLAWQHFIVVQSRRGVVGCGQLRPHRDGSAELASLAVRPSWQGRGIGAALVGTLVSIAGNGVYLMCDGKMQAYYERFGFRIVPARELPSEMRLFYRMGEGFTWAARALFRHPVRIVTMRLNRV